MNIRFHHVHLGPAVRALRLAAGLSLREMARRMGVSAAYLSGVELEKVTPPTHDRLRSMAEALGVPERRLTALSDRISPELVAFLEGTPEAVRFLRAAREAGLEGADFLALAEQVGRKDAARESGDPAPHALALGRLLDRSRIWCRWRARSKEGLLERMTRHALRRRDDALVEAAVAAVLAREAESSTGLGGGVALSHAEVPGLADHLLGVCTLARRLEFEAIDGHPVELVFLLLGADGDPAGRLEILARIAELCVRPGLAAGLVAARSPGKIHDMLLRADARED